MRASAVSWCLILAAVAVSTLPALSRHDERLALFDDVGGELGCVGGADVPGRVHRAGRNEKDLPGRQGDRRFAFEAIFQGAFDHIDDLFAGVAVVWREHAGRDIDAGLDELASRDAQIVLLKIGALDARLRPRRLKTEHAGADEQRDRDDLPRVHVDLLCLERPERPPSGWSTP